MSRTVERQSDGVPVIVSQVDGLVDQAFQSEEVAILQSLGGDGETPASYRPFLPVGGVEALGEHRSRAGGAADEHPVIAVLLHLQEGDLRGLGVGLQSVEIHRHIL